MNKKPITCGALAGLNLAGGLIESVSVQTAATATG